MNSARFWTQFVVANKVPESGPDVIVGNNKWALYCDIIKEQQCSVQNAPRHQEKSLACQNTVCQYIFFTQFVSYDMFLYVPSVAMINNCLTLLSTTSKDMNNDSCSTHVVMPVSQTGHGKNLCSAINSCPNWLPNLTWWSSWKTKNYYAVWSWRNTQVYYYSAFKVHTVAFKVKWRLYCRL